MSVETESRRDFNSVVAGALGLLGASSSAQVSFAC